MILVVLILALFFFIGYACAGVLRKLENEAVKPTEKLCFGYAAKMFEEAFTIVPEEAERSET